MLTFEELKKREGTGVAETPKQLQKKGIIQKAGEFLAPTTTGLLTGDKPVSAKTLLGAGLEIGSFAIPSGAILKGLGLAGKAAIVAKGATTLARGAKVATGAAKVAPKVISGAAPLTFDALKGKLGQSVGKLGTQAKRAGAIGGVSGAMFGAGRELGEEGSGLKDVASGAVAGGLGGAIGGAVLAPAISLTASGAQAGTRLLSKAIKGTVKKLSPLTRKEAVDSLTNSYLSSFVEDKANVNKALDKAFVQARRGRGVVPTSKEALVRELAEEGYVPTVEGELANMRSIIDDLAKKRGDLGGKLDEFLKPIKKKTSLNSLKSRVIREIEDDFSVDDITKSLSKVEQVFNVLKRKYGSSISAFELNQLRKEMNKATSAFKGMMFQDDALNTIGRITGEAIEDVAPAPVVRGINGEIARLFRLSKVAEIFHNKKIDAGFLNDSFGRFLGTVFGTAGLATLGLGGGIIGSGGLVIAGVLARMGQAGVANLVRRSRFNPNLVNIIKQTVNRNIQLKNSLLKEATNKADKALLEKIFKNP